MYPDIYLTSDLYEILHYVVIYICELAINLESELCAAIIAP